MTEFTKSMTVVAFSATTATKEAQRTLMVNVVSVVQRVARLVLAPWSVSVGNTTSLLAARVKTLAAVVSSIRSITSQTVQRRKAVAFIERINPTVQMERLYAETTIQRDAPVAEVTVG
jgi:hypothetical protein